ncbi:hypothetical protein PsorP6_017841 [Peronosclerospora sorghi]|uniref:Uncharacterized protein n=1 Tax=Peronosclerospora sorghi TaxID=230839 RepID=A0ACC0WDL5_9STRA|nr:hypothetical protein PsorP6_017841 [Peronosclerospora sorghi]
MGKDEQSSVLQSTIQGVEFSPLYCCFLPPEVRKALVIKLVKYYDSIADERDASSVGLILNDSDKRFKSDSSRKIKMDMNALSDKREKVPKLQQKKKKSCRVISRVLIEV